MAADTIDLHSVRILPEAIDATLGLPPDPVGLVLFAHGSGSSRMSPRNIYVAEQLRDAGFATLLIDLLLAHEQWDRANVFDITLLARRLLAAIRWADGQDRLSRLPIGLFGASTGAGAALVAAAALPQRVAAVVSRGGRPDLAGAGALARVRAPTLLIVGSLDTDVLALNRAAASHLRCAHELSIIPGAGHLFEEPGTMDMVVDRARAWFARHLKPQGAGE